MENLLKEHADNKNLFDPIQDSMWTYVFDPKRHLSFAVDYLESFWADPNQAKEWKEIGWGRDRDIGSCRLLLNIKTGKIGRYFYSDFMDSDFCILNCTLSELVKASHLFQTPEACKCRYLKDFLRDKLTEHERVDKRKLGDDLKAI